MKRLFFAFAIILGTVCQAQTRWVNPFDEGAEMHGQGWSELRQGFMRLPDKAKGTVRGPVWGLSRNSAGLNLVFRSNASEIKVRYQVSGGLNMFHMPSTGVSGLDMYATDTDGDIRWCAPKFTPSFKDTITYTYSDITYFPSNSRFYEYHLYLPLYNTVKWLEIGVPENAELTFYKETLEKPIVVYGTSIAQGACASRPGMAWTGIIERELEHPVINLAFSGNGKLEPELFDLLDEIDAGMYILDCLPNLNTTNPVVDLALAGVRKLRKHHDCPILLVEHSGHSNEVTKMASSSYRMTNAELRKAYKLMLEEGIKDIYYLSHDEIGLGMDGMVEGVHPNDLGMRRQADAYERKIREILHEECEPYQPCKQNRDGYIWHDRHESVLSLCRERKPATVLIGDSITHYWGGEPEASKNGAKAWDKLWKDSNVLNLGFGWDRIENVLWRIYHGELDGWNAENVILLIGTNNLSIDTNEKIVAGINQIVDAIHVHQPAANVYVCGITPRNGSEKRIELLNQMLQTSLHTDIATYVDMTRLLVGENGRIKKELFLDGLHPNEKGYECFAEMLLSAGISK